MIKRKEISETVFLIKKKGLIFFVGAGISIQRPSKLPSLYDLQKNIIDSLLVSLSNKMKRKLAPAHKISKDLYNLIPELIFQICDNEIATKIDEKYFSLKPLKALINKQPNYNHYILSNLLLKGYSPAIFTTNFDCLLEISLNNLCKRFTSRKKLLMYHKHYELEHKSKNPKLYKLHGSIDDFNSIVITLSEIGKRCASDRMNILKSYLEKYYVLFAGYRGADLDIYAQMAVTKCKGIIWNTLSKNSLLPKIKKWLKIQNAKIIEGDLNKLFISIGYELGITRLDIDQNVKTDAVFSFKEWVDGIENWSKALIIADMFEHITKWKKAIDFFRIGLRLARGEKNIKVEALFLNRLSSAYYKIKDYKIAKRFLQEQLQIAERFDYPLRLYEFITAFQLMGLITFHEKKIVKNALTYFQKSLEYQEQLEKVDEKSSYRKAEIFANIADLFYIGGFLKEASKIFINALSIFDKFGDIHGRAQILANLGNLNLQWKKLDKAIFLYKEAKYLFAETGDIFELPKIYLNLAIAAYQKNEMQSAILHAKKAGHYFYLVNDRYGIAKVKALLKKIQLNNVTESISKTTE